MQPLRRLVTDHVHAGFSGLWVLTHEPDEAQREIHQEHHATWNVLAWDVAQGLYHPGHEPLQQTVGDPLKALQTVAASAESGKPTVALLHNFHRFLQNPVVVQELFNQVVWGKAHQCSFAVLAPLVQIPPELEKVFVVLEHPLPDLEALFDVKEGLVGEEEFASTENQTQAVEAARGLTRYEAEGAFALSLARHGGLRPEVVWELKASLLKKSGLLTLHQGKETFADLGGLQAVKDFCRRALVPASSGRPRPRGILLLGVPGTGKSAFAKALGNEVGRPTLLADPGSWKGSLVGETGQKTRQALKVADAMAPCVLFIDEIEKALAGATADHQGDGGVSADQLGALLTWLNDHTSDVFVIATSNDVSRLPPEFSRAERWDAVFFLDLPAPQERFSIWRMYAEAFAVAKIHVDPELDWAKILPGDGNWTGAEIKACCRLAALLDIPLSEAASYVVPVASTAADKVSALREWASGRALDASAGGLFRHQKVALAKCRRKLSAQTN